jgi:sulfiredoxin
MLTFTASRAISPMQVIGMGRPGGRLRETISKPNATALPLSYFEARFSTSIGERRVLKSKAFPIEKIYVPTKRRQTLDVEKVRQIAESILQNGQDTPIMVRQDGERLVLVEGLHRLEACRSLGEQTILGYLVQARKH